MYMSILFIGWVDLALMATIILVISVFFLFYFGDLSWVAMIPQEI